MYANAFRHIGLLKKTSPATGKEDFERHGFMITYHGGFRKKRKLGKKRFPHCKHL